MTSNNYWNNKGKYQMVGDLLKLRIPISGSVENAKKNKALEKFRKASNCYYDLYNNGLWNRASEFRGVFGVSASRYKRPWEHRHQESLYDLVEDKMDDIIKAAAMEQGLALHFEYAI